MKKLILTFPVLVFAFVLAASSASAFNFPRHNDGGKLTVSSVNNSTLNNEVSTWSNTGANFSGGLTLNNVSLNRGSRHSFPQPAGISTGTATALSELQNTVGVNETRLEVSDDNELTVGSANYTSLTNTVRTGANSGFNFVSGSSIKTGVAGSRTTLINFIGSNVTEIED